MLKAKIDNEFQLSWMASCTYIKKLFIVLDTFWYNYIQTTYGKTWYLFKMKLIISLNSYRSLWHIIFILTHWTLSISMTSDTPGISNNRLSHEVSRLTHFMTHLCAEVLSHWPSFSPKTQGDIYVMSEFSTFYNIYVYEFNTSASLYEV